MSEGGFWDDLQAEARDPEWLAAYVEAHEFVTTLDGIANLSRTTP